MDEFGRAVFVALLLLDVGAGAGECAKDVWSAWLLNVVQRLLQNGAHVADKFDVHARVSTFGFCLVFRGQALPFSIQPLGVSQLAASHLAISQRSFPTVAPSQLPTHMFGLHGWQFPGLQCLNFRFRIFQVHSLHLHNLQPRNRAIAQVACSQFPG